MKVRVIAGRYHNHNIQHDDDDDIRSEGSSYRVFSSAISSVAILGEYHVDDFPGAP